MNLLKRQFDVLTYLESKKEEARQTQRAISIGANISIGGVNKTLSELENEGLAVDGFISKEGMLALEPYKVKRAIFLAAGFGERLIPVTLNTPKPLVRVNGVRLIDTMIDAVLAAGIEEIVVVRGYLSEQFDQLLSKYPMIKFIENPDYRETKNISSVMLVRDMLGNSYVFDADFLLYNPSLVTKYQYVSNYLTYKVDVTDDWCMGTKNGVITKLGIGGRNCYQMMSFVYINKEDGKRLADDVPSAYEMPGGKENFWDQVALEIFAKDYKIYIRECSPEDIKEIDNYSELKMLDKSYK